MTKKDLATIVLGVIALIMGFAACVMLVMATKNSHDVQQFTISLCLLFGMLVGGITTVITNRLTK